MSIAPSTFWRPTPRRALWPALLSILLAGAGAAEIARAEAPRAAPCAEALPDIFDRASPAVVSISATSINPYRLSERVSHIVGSGVLIDASGLILTNAHVAFGRQSITVTLDDGTRLLATLVGADPIFDLAVLRIPKPSGTALPTVALGDSDRTRVGEEVLAIGNPLGLDQTLTRGIVSGMNRVLPETPFSLLEPLIQTDAPINPGNSGGPLLDEHDEVVGVVYAVDHAAKPSARAKQAADLMRGWDGRMLASSAAPTIAQMSIRELRRLLLEPKLGTAPSSAKEDSVLNWRTYSWEMRSIWLENILLHRPKRWLPDKYSNYDELLTAAVDAAVNDANAPKDLASWRWGAFNAVEIQHPILKNIPVIRRWSGPGVQEQSGSGYTVKAVSRSHGPSERFTANLADLDQSTLNIVTGQGGNFLSPYYMDQWKAWYEGTTFTLPFSAKAVEAAKTHRLLLEPGK